MGRGLTMLATVQTGAVTDCQHHVSSLQGKHRLGLLRGQKERVLTAEPYSHMTAAVPVRCASMTANPVHGAPFRQSHSPHLRNQTQHIKQKHCTESCSRPQIQERAGAQTFSIHTKQNHQHLCYCTDSGGSGQQNCVCAQTWTLANNYYPAAAT